MAMRLVWVSPIPSSQQRPLLTNNNTPSHFLGLHSASSFSATATPLTLCSSSSTTPSTSTSLVEEEDDDDAVSSTSPVSDKLPSGGGCVACGREEIEKGCNGEGRIQGGIATVPGFGWWPIKAYRPCPGFLASGGRYTRQGQSMDEVAFGRGPQDTPTTTDKPAPKKKKKNPRKFTR